MLGPADPPNDIPLVLSLTPVLPNLEDVRSPNSAVEPTLGMLLNLISALGEYPPKYTPLVLSEAAPPDIYLLHNQNLNQRHYLSLQY